MRVRNKKRTCKSHIKDQTVNQESFINRNLNNIIQQVFANDSKLGLTFSKYGVLEEILDLSMILLPKF